MFKLIGHKFEFLCFLTRGQGGIFTGFDQRVCGRQDGQESAICSWCRNSKLVGEINMATKSCNLGKRQIRQLDLLTQDIVGGGLVKPEKRFLRGN